AGFEVSYHVALARNFIKQYLYALGVSILLAILLLLAVILFIYFQIYIPKDMTFLFGYGQFIIFGFLTYTSVSVLYYFGTIEGRKTRFFSPGALMTTLLFFLMTYLYGIYIDNFSNYNQLYGSIGALLIFLLYIWMNSNTLLLGFELNATLNRFKREPKASS
ncbi:YihY/virulence factor BrkB family protein, partial [Flavobacteriaceae bacterium]|nr:YihY/virulence factor BrkB family protein [Flavobacteriaceae bacterium]